MDMLNGKPQLLKAANLSLVRNTLISRGTATRAELARETGISSTTVRSLLCQLVEGGEVECLGLDASSGGRKAARYRLAPGRYHGAAFCIAEGRADALLVDARGDILRTTPLEGHGEDFEAAISAYLDPLHRGGSLRAIGLGVPGVVDGTVYWRKDRDEDTLRRMDLGERLSARYGVPLVLENDIRATTLGFGRCYAREFPGERPEDADMAYLYFEKGCLSGGFLAGGRVVRGHRNFAGELGLIPMADGRFLDQHLYEPMDDRAYTALLLQIAGWLSAVLNPQYLALGGPDFRPHCLSALGEGLSALLPAHMVPELLYAADRWHDYHDGMAALTAGRMFDEIQLIQE